MASEQTTSPIRNPVEEALLKALYDALREDQVHSGPEPSSGVSVGALDLRRSAIFLATEANWRMWLREATNDAR